MTYHRLIREGRYIMHWPSIHLSIYTSILFIYPSIYLSINPFYLSIHFIYPSIHPFYWFIHPFVHLFIHVFIHLSIYWSQLSIHPSTQPFILCMDLTCIYYFRHMMEEQECLEWSYREKEISAIQLERIELLEKSL